MEDYVSIIVAVISLVTSLLAAALTAGIGPFVTSSAKERKARREAEELFQKYRKKLFSAANNLQSRLSGIINFKRYLDFHDKSPRHQDELYIYTSFAFGELLAWTHILEDQIELLPFLLETIKSLDRFIDLIYEIRTVLIRYEPGVEDSDLWMSSGAQMAISELMVEVGGSGGAERKCIGYSEFGRRWHASGSCEEDRDSLRYWFDAVVCGLQILMEKDFGTPETWRLRRLQHLLVDLMMLLDPVKALRYRRVLRRCGAAPGCPCSECREGPALGAERKSLLTVLKRKSESV